MPAPHDDPKHDEKSAKLLDSVTAYAGTYVVKGDELVVHVEVAWRPDWVGTDQPRRLRIEGDEMSIRTQPMRSASTGKDSVYVLTWRRVR